MGNTIPRSRNRVTVNRDLERELEKLEQESQQRLDDKIIVVCCALLGLSLLIINTIRPIVQQNLINYILFLFVVIFLGITIAYSVYGHHCSSQTFRNYNIKLHYNPYLEFNRDKVTKRIKQLNFIQISAFIGTIVSIVLTLIFLVGNYDIWKVRAFLWIALCFGVTVVYYLHKIVNSYLCKRYSYKCNNIYLKIIPNIILLLIFFEGISFIWLIKTQDIITQVLS